MSEWIKWEWTEEKPYPETLETRVHVIYGDDDVSRGHMPVSFWYGNGDCDDSNWHKNCQEDARITHYKLA